MKTFEQILEVPGAANILAAKLVGRVIDQVARGFGDDESLEDSISLFKAIEQKYPEDTISLPNLFKRIRKSASTDTDEGLKLEGLTPEQQALWKAEGVESERDALDKSMPRLTELLQTTKPDAGAWGNLPTIAQWSLLHKVEESLPSRIAIWSGYAETDRRAGKTNTKAIRLEKQYADAITPLYDIVTKFLGYKAVQKELDQCKEAGINVPVRVAA